MLCKFCEKELNSKIKKFCDNKCQGDFQYRVYIESWLNGTVSGIRGNYFLSKHIRRYIFEIKFGKCEVCGWSKINQFTGKFPLEVHHKDGDSTNNNLDNLMLLCPNCHSLTENYKSLNKNSKRIRI